MSAADAFLGGAAALLLGLAWAEGGRAADASKAAAEAFAPVVLGRVEGDALLVLGAGGRGAFLDDGAAGGVSRPFRLPAAVGGLATGRDVVYVAAADPAGRIFEIALDSGAVRRSWRVGHTPSAVALAPGGRRLYVANRFDGTVSVIDLPSGRARTVPVGREPIALALTPDGRRLFVAHHLPVVEPFLDDENPFIAAEVWMLDADDGRVAAVIELPNGSQGLRSIAVSPDGRHAAVPHILSRYTVPAWRIEGGAMNANAVSVLDAVEGRWIGTALLDDPGRGAANPWAAAFSGDGRRLLVTHAGTHELSVIDWPALRARLAAGASESVRLDGIRTRVSLPATGPRAVVERDGVAHLAGYFSDSVARVDLRGRAPRVDAIALDGVPPAPTPARLGERYFHEASLCRQQWQSCSSCHPDARSDALYWDLLNDGVGNTKNTKSLLLAAETAPVMWRGVRADAGAAVRAGIHHIQFAEPTPGQAEAIEAYLRSLAPVPSPARDADRPESPRTNDASCARCHRSGPAVPALDVSGPPRGSLSPAARRGQEIFQGRAGCAECHPHPLFTNRASVDPGLGSGVAYDVPSLVEVWRTAPYLHSGDALTLRETVIDFNAEQKRGRTKDLTEAEIDDLIEYLRSL